MIINPIPYDGNCIKRVLSRLVRAADLALIPAGVLLYGILLYEYACFSPFAEVPVLDAQYNYRVAVDAALLGKGLPAIFFSAPLYPLTLAFWVLATSGNFYALYVIQLALGLASIFFIARTASNIFSPSRGVIAGWLCLLYFTPAFFCLKLLPETLSILLLTLFLYFCTHPGLLTSHARLALLGLSGGLLVLARTQAAPLVAACIIFAFWFGRPRQIGGKVLWGVTIAVIFAVLPVFLWGAVNMGRTGHFSISPPNGGITFYQGNNAAATGTYTPIPGVGNDVNSQLYEMVDMVSRETGRRVTVREADRYFWKKALLFIRENPWEWLRLEIKKIRLTIGIREPGLIYDQYLESLLHLPVNKLFPVNWAMLSALALLGLMDVLVFRREFFRWVFPLLISIFFLGLALLTFYVVSRYRVLLLCPVAVLAAHGVASVADWAVSRRFAAFFLALALLFAVLVNSFIFRPAISPGAMNNLAYALIRNGLFREAELFSRKVLAVLPNDTIARYNLKSAISAQQQKVVDVKKNIKDKLEGSKNVLSESR